MVWISGSVAYRTQSPERERERESIVNEQKSEQRATSPAASSSVLLAFLPSCVSILPSIPTLLQEARLRIISEIRAGVGVCVCVYLYELQNDPLIHVVLAYLQTVSMYH